MLFSIWYVFGVAGTGCFFLCVVPLSGALVKQAWWWQNLWVLACSQKILFFLHLWSLVWLDMKFWAENSFFLRILNVGPHCFLAWRVSAKKSALTLLGFPLWVTWSFSLAAFSIFTFISTLVNLTIMCLGIAFLGEYLWAVLCISWIWMLTCLAKLGKFFWVISCRVFSNLDSFSPSHSGIPIKCRFGHFT